jgi:hypothetical protein
MRAWAGFIIGTAVLSACAAPSGDNLAAGLKGIDQAKFLSCSGPPSISLTEEGQERMSFLTNGSQGMGLVNPAAAPMAACLGNAVFQQGKLADVTFSGDPDTCVRVFGPCAQK